MSNFFNILCYIFRLQILIVLGLYFYSVIEHRPISFFTRCYDWYEEEDTCKNTNLRIALLLILFAQDIVYSYKTSIAICSPLFYTISFLFFLSIFSISCNINIDIITVVYNFFLFFLSYLFYNEYETIDETRNKTHQKDTNDDYPNVEVRTFTKKRPQTVYYQAIDEI